jgi:hypothetical protein
LKKYKKSNVQLQKERERRRKLRNYVINHPMLESLNQTELARVLGCSQSTVSRDLKKLGSLRWNPFRQIALRRETELREGRRGWFDESDQIDEYLSIEQKRKRVEEPSKFMSLLYGGGYVYSRRLKPRGKPFTKEYQPRLGRWGFWPFRCLRCGYEGRVEITGFWQRGEKAAFNCPRCREVLAIMRPELPVERRGFTAPCGYSVVVTIKVRWERNLDVLFDCPKCGKEHRIEKRFTSRA